MKKVSFSYISLFFILLSTTICVAKSNIDAEEREINLASGCSLGASYSVCDGLSAGSLKILQNGHDVRCGELLLKSQTQSAPEVSYNNANQGSSYTMLMVDPDAPSPSHPIMKHWLHWMVSDISGSDIDEGKVSGNELKAYAGPSPPAGIHRYQFLLFKQEGNSNLQAPDARGHFDPFTFAEKNNLCLVAFSQYKVKSG